MTLDEAKANFGRRAVYTEGLVTEQVEIEAIWGDRVQIMVGYGNLRLVTPESLTLVADG